jgi:hypothetical protein
VQSISDALDAALAQASQQLSAAQKLDADTLGDPDSTAENIDFANQTLQNAQAEYSAAQNNATAGDAQAASAWNAANTAEASAEDADTQVDTTEFWVANADVPGSLDIAAWSAQGAATDAQTADSAAGIAATNLQNAGAIPQPAPNPEDPNYASGDDVGNGDSTGDGDDGGGALESDAGGDDGMGGTGNDERDDDE